MRHFLESASYFNFLKYITSMPDANATANIVVLIFCHFCLCLMINSYRFFHYKSFGDLFCRLCRIPFMRNLIATVNSEKDDAKNTHTYRAKYLQYKNINPYYENEQNNRNGIH